MLVSWQCVVRPDQRVVPRGPSGDAASKWCVACLMPRSSNSRARDTPAFAWTRSCLWLGSTRPRSIDAGRAGPRWSLLSSIGCASLFARARCRTLEIWNVISSRHLRDDSPSARRSKAEPGHGCSTSDTVPRSKRSSETWWTSVAASGGRWSRAPSTGAKYRQEPIRSCSCMSSARSSTPAGWIRPGWSSPCGRSLPALVLERLSGGTEAHRGRMFHPPSRRSGCSRCPTRAHHGSSEPTG
jgi:hypothetical protein